MSKSTQSLAPTGVQSSGFSAPSGSASFLNRNLNLKLQIKSDSFLGVVFYALFILFRTNLKLYNHQQINEK